MLGWVGFGFGFGFGFGPTLKGEKFLAERCWPEALRAIRVWTEFGVFDVLISCLHPEDVPVPSAPMVSTALVTSVGPIDVLKNKK